MVAKKLLADNKIAACVKQICLLDIICKVSNGKTLSGEMFAFLKNVHLLFWFYELLIGLQPTFLECIVIFV